MKLVALLVLAGLMVGQAVRAQAPEGTLSEAEVEQLRDASFIPMDCISTYEKILDKREKEIEELMAKPRHAGRELDLHDLMEQMAAITDELTDHLDDYTAKHRDVRKALPKLVQATERWATALRAPPDNDAYKVVRKLALDNLKDLHDLAQAMGPGLEAYFKEHPEALKLEKERLEHAHDARVPQ